MDSGRQDNSSSYERRKRRYAEISSFNDDERDVAISLLSFAQQQDSGRNFGHVDDTITYTQQSTTDVDLSYEDFRRSKVQRKLVPLA